ncbi:MAG: hypothetical protein GY795_38815 [Desulfobacterales bacterium]|nr:hypothetical protein [Desulfobacterales bacterium]
MDCLKAALCCSFNQTYKIEPALFDTRGFARNLEKAYKEMWEIFLAGKASANRSEK